ncbi:MAG TPA: MFS transporter [Acetobacteraceae bacterium]|nr:MFS transporter [Acetobacteraceae bacterium]
MGQRDATTSRSGWLLLGLLWLLGADLRLTILAVPPVLPLIHHDLHLDEKLVAALTGLPVLLFGVIAIPGSLLIARIGARRAAIAGVLIVSIASALRGVGPSVPMLFGMTALMGAGVAIMQPALPTLVGRWFPQRISLATALYANGLLVGEMLPASLTIPLVLPALGGSWEASFVFWAAPVLATAFLVLFLTPHTEPSRRSAPARWWPDWHDVRTWQLGCMLGGGSALYFGCNAFLPDYLHAIGRADLLNAALTALNSGQIPASLLVMAVGKHLVGRKEPFIVMSVIGLLCLAGLLVPAAPVIVLSAGLIGFAAAFTLILSLALPPLLAETHDVHRLAAGMLALGYTITFIVPYIAGAVWDATHLTASALIPGVAGDLLVIGVAATFRRTPATHPLPEASR